MKVKTKNLVSISEANQNFSKVAKKVDNDGNVIILRNNKPAYILAKFDEEEYENELLESIARRILKEHHRAFEVLGQ